MARPGCRPFTIADAMILVAATAIGLAWSSQAFPGLIPMIRTGVAPMYRTRDILSAILDGLVFVATLVLPGLSAWTLALVVLRLRSPRPSWRRITAQPGMVACLAATKGLAVLGIFGIALVLAIWRGGEWSAFIQSGRVAGSFLLVFRGVSYLVGCCVLGAWGVLALQRRWRLEPGWIDRCGRLLGVVWLLVAGIFGTYFFLQKYS